MANLAGHQRPRLVEAPSLDRGGDGPEQVLKAAGTRLASWCSRAKSGSPVTAKARAALSGAAKHRPQVEILFSTSSGGRRRPYRLATSGRDRLMQRQ